MIDIRYGALVGGALVSLGIFYVDAVGAKPAQDRVGAPKKVMFSSPAVHDPTEEQRVWSGRVGEFSKVAAALEDKLIAGDVDAAVSLMPPTIEDSMGVSVEQYVREELVPFFCDYKESDNYIYDQGVRENGSMTGFNIYKGFRTKSAGRKYYVLRVLSRNGRPTVTSFRVNRRIEDDDPEMAQQLKERRPQVESIRPSDSNQVIWSAPGTK
jgi:hypothetical protein